MLSKKSNPWRRVYSEAFKLQVVREYEQGVTTKDALMRKYQLGGKSLVLDWCRKYGKFPYPKTTVTGRPMKDPQKQRIKQLEHELKEAKERLMVYEKLIEIAKEEAGVDIRKNIATKLSENWQSNHKK